MVPPLLSGSHISKIFSIQQGFLAKRTPFVALDDVSVTLFPGETLGIVGESGSGKSTLGEILGGLRQATSGTIHFEGAEVSHLEPARLRDYRRNVQFVFQDPKGSMNPYFTVEKVITEPLVALGICKDKKQNRKTAEQILEQVGLQANTIEKYPGEMSGGQCQRVAIARALVVNPKVIVCDEAVSALDVSVQKQVVLELLRLRELFGTAIVLVTHNIGVASAMADTVLVLHNGQVMEYGPAQQVLHTPQNDYTKRLLAAVPRLRRH